MDRILIRDLVARGIIGINEWERKNPQEILINLILFCDTHQAAKEDSIEHSVDYRAIAKQVLAHAETAARFTVEALAEDLAELCLSHPRVSKVLVRVEKPGAVRFARSVGVEIERSREEKSQK
ncbi:MAG: dihydroneopterin aldolase [Anaerolineales bacterium]|nr:dihydroneopterin aldolase [Anaerolineales bacterium]MDW8161561.1 dihydroneopterin aldolase [Anaerolineales bacterium]